jgi:hypothetical protein
MQPDFGKALSWYRLAADQGNKNGIDNLQALTNILQQQGDDAWQAANESASDAALAQAQRRERIQDLHRRINELEADAAQQDNLADRLEHTGKTNDAMGKIFNAIGSISAIQYRQQAQQYRDQAAGLRDELAQTENQSQFSANVPVQ